MSITIHSRVAATALAVALLTSAPVMAQDRFEQIQVPIDITLELRSALEALGALEFLQLDLNRLAGRDLGRAVSRDVVEGVRKGLGSLRDLDRIGRFDRIGRLDLQGRNFQSEQTDDETHTLDIGSSGSLDLRNVAGDITVTAGSDATVSVHVTRVARGRTDEDARQGLERVPVEVTSRDGRASVVARHPGNQGSKDYRVSVTYDVTAPAGTRLTIDSVAGDVTVRGIHGDIAVDLISGDIEIEDATRLAKVATVSGSVTLTDIDSDDAVNITNLAGTVRLERVRATRVEVNAVAGAITASDITANGAMLTTMAGRIAYSGSLGSSGRYEFQAHGGDIDLTVVGSAGFELRASTFSGSIDTESGIATSGLSRSRRSLQGRVGDGDAVVSLTTFSGSINIRRR